MNDQYQKDLQQAILKNAIVGAWACGTNGMSLEKTLELFLPCDHPETIDLGDSEHSVIGCAKCETIFK